MDKGPIIKLGVGNKGGHLSNDYCINGEIGERWWAGTDGDRVK
jgi:hypothetical protein